MYGPTRSGPTRRIIPINASTESFARTLPSPRIRAWIAPWFVVSNGSSASNAIDFGFP